MSESRTDAAPELRYKAGDVCRMADVQPYVLRYWESEFSVLAPDRNAQGPRLYTPRDVKIIERIKKLLYDEGYTIAGAKKRLEGEMKDGEAVPAAAPRVAVEAEAETRAPEKRAAVPAARSRAAAAATEPRASESQTSSDIANFELASPPVAALATAPLLPESSSAPSGDKPRRARPRVAPPPPDPIPTPVLFEPELGPDMPELAPPDRAPQASRRVVVEPPAQSLADAGITPITFAISSASELAARGAPEVRAEIAAREAAHAGEAAVSAESREPEEIPFEVSSAVPVAAHGASASAPKRDAPDPRIARVVTELREILELLTRDDR